MKIPLIAGFDKDACVCVLVVVVVVVVVGGGGGGGGGGSYLRSYDAELDTTVIFLDTESYENNNIFSCYLK